MVLVLGDNFEFFFAIFLVTIDDFSLFVDFSHELFGNEMMLLPRLMSFSITIFSSVREFLITKIITCVQIHRAQNYFSREEIILFFRTLPGSVLVLLNQWMSINATKCTFLMVDLCASR